MSEEWSDLLGPGENRLEWEEEFPQVQAAVLQATEGMSEGDLIRFLQGAVECIYYKGFIEAPSPGMARLGFIVERIETLARLSHYPESRRRIFAEMLKEKLRIDNEEDGRLDRIVAE